MLFEFLLFKKIIWRISSLNSSARVRVLGNTKMEKYEKMKNVLKRRNEKELEEIGRKEKILSRSGQKRKGVKKVREDSGFCCDFLRMYSNVF